MPHLRASAPTRLDFGGGWTDVPPFPQHRGGFVCGLAIERRATVVLSSETTPLADPAPPSALVAAALDDAGLSGLSASVHNDFPVGAGLGGSSAAGVALAAATAAWSNPPDSREHPGALARFAPSELAALAEASRRIEVERLGIAGGRQDHYAAAFGGALALEFTDAVQVQSLPLSPEMTAGLESRCLVYYTGESRISGDTIRAVLSGYEEGQSTVVFALDRMASLARLMAAAIVHGDIDSLGALVGEHWVHQKALHEGITTARIDALIEAAAGAGALGAKALGASGGGCVVIVAAAERVDEVRAAADPLAERLPFRIAESGVQVQVEPVD